MPVDRPVSLAPVFSVWPAQLVANAAFVRVSAEPSVDAEVRLERQGSVLAAAAMHGDRAVLWGPFRDCGDMLCEGVAYEVWVDGQQVASISAGPALPDGPQWLGEGALLASDTSVRLRRETSRPCLLTGLGEPVTWAGELVIDGLLPGRSYDWALACVDGAGIATRPWRAQFQTEPPIDVRLAELVVAPRHDWNDSSGSAGVPYDGQPGPAAEMSSADQWVELVNLGDEVSVAAWSIEVLGPNGGAYVLGIGEAFAAQPLRAFGSFELARGARLVRRLSGSSAASRSACVTLRDELGHARDQVCLGADGVPSGSDGEAIARCADSWRVATPSPGSDCL